MTTLVEQLARCFSCCSKSVVILWNHCKFGLPHRLVTVFDTFHTMIFSRSVLVAVFSLLVSACPTNSVVVKRSRKTKADAGGDSVAELLVCPKNTVQVGGLGADIAGCGLTPCDKRYSSSTPTKCKQVCNANPACLAFSFAPVGGDINHGNVTVCTQYNSVVAPDVWYGIDKSPQQIFCRLESSYPKTTKAAKSTKAPSSNPTPDI